MVFYFPAASIHSSDPSAGDKHENFCRTKMMLHHFSTNVHDQDLADVVDGRIAILIILMNKRATTTWELPC